MSLVIRSPAKINWTLRVLGRRDDGFHEIESLVSAVSLYDELAFSFRDDTGFVLTCDDPTIPTDERNLISRAVAIARPEAAEPRGLTCHLSKRIPVGGGLGGGSSNGAAALVALNQLWSLNWSREQLMSAAARLGSDVPFFILGGTAVIAGRGERVSTASLPWQGWIVLMMPGFSVSTAEVYRAWQPTRDFEPSGAIGEGLSAVKWMQKAYNMLEEPAMAVCPALRGLVRQAMELVDRPVRISGSGATFFTAYDTEQEARDAAERLSRELRVRIEVVKPIERTQ